MAHYIDKDALVAEIEKLKADALQKKSQCKRSGLERIMHQIGAYNKVISLINTLEVKEVDLEKEYKMFIDHDNGRSMFETAKHFFELGIKLKQTSEDVKIGETKIYLNDDGGEPPYDGKQWIDLSCTEYEIPEDKFKDGDDVELIIRKKQKGGKL